MASSLQSYLKRYTSGPDKPKKKKKRTKPSALQKTGFGGAVTIVDDDAAWQKEIKEDASDDEEEDQDYAPQVIKDVEVKRMQKLELLKMHRPYLSMGDDGSGWVTVSDLPKQCSDSPVRKGGLGLSPPRRDQRDTSEESPPRKSSPDMSPQRKTRHDTPDLSPPRKSRLGTPDLSPPRKNQRSTPPPRKSQDGTPALSPARNSWHETRDLSPPTKRRHDSPDLSPPRKSRLGAADLSPPRKNRPGTPPSRKSRQDTPALSPARNLDLSPPRKRRHNTAALSPSGKDRHDSPDLSPPRKSCKKAPNLSPPRQKRQHVASDSSLPTNGPEKREKMTDGTAAGLRSGRQLVEEIEQKKKEDARRFSEMDTSISGRGADTVYRDKHGRRLESLDEFMKLQEGGKKPKEKPLEWGKGLAQKREAETKQAELEMEKNKPFARSRDDPDLDRHLKERIRWGDPMAHLVKNKSSEHVLEDLGESKQMRESGFIVPQDIPKHSWLKRGIGPPPNRYGIKPGRHWDGVDRSTGFERDMYKKQNEKKATELEAYLWSVSDM